MSDVPEEGEVDSGEQSTPDVVFDLTALAEAGKLDPVVGRTAEIDRILRALSRRKRRHLLLVGESGVGKTALLHAVTQILYEGRGVPKSLIGTRVGIVDLALTSKIAAVFKEEISAISDELFSGIRQFTWEGMTLRVEAGENRPLPLICIEHPEMWPGVTAEREAEIDLGLWALLEIDIPVILTTVPESPLAKASAEFAVAEKIDRISVVELSVPDSVEAVRAAVPDLAMHHGVVIDDDAVAASVELADRYITHKLLPAKAVDLLDDACALVALHLARKPRELADLEAEIYQLQNEQANAVAAEDFEGASALRRRITNLELRQVMLADAWRTGELSGRSTVNAHAVLAVASEHTGIPVEELEYEPARTARTGGLHVSAPAEPRLPIKAASTALLIVNGQYEDPFIEDIPAARNNLEDLHTCLAHPAHGTFAPDRVIPIDSLDYPKLAIIADAARDTTDTLLVYYSGHGFVADDGRFYLGMRGTGSDKWKHTGMPYDQLRSAVIDSPAANKLIVLDCCYSGQAIDMLADANGLGGQLDVEGTYVLTASSGTRLAHAPEGHRNSAFTAELLDILANGLDNGSEVIRVAELYPRLRSSLAAKGFSDPQQRGTNNIGQLAIVKNPFGKDREIA
jgi:ATP-dependent Clp protease ATP-binding subunit ClpC